MNPRFSVVARALALVGVRPGEGRRTSLLFLYLLFASAVFILGRTVRDTLFLSRYSLAALPWMFVLYGVASAITAVVYSRFADKIPRHVAILASLGIGVGTYLGVWALVRSGVHLVYPVFYVWSEVAANLFIVQFWTLANDLHDPRSAKRLFGTIGAARILGVVIVGTTAGIVVRAIGTAQLLFVLVAMMLCMGAIAWSLSKEPRPEAEATRPLRARSHAVTKNPYVRALALFLLLAFTALTLGDYQFKAIARATYREDALAQFFALFYAATGIVSFVFQIVVTPRLLRRLGVSYGMSVMPGVFGAASVLLPLFSNLGVASAMKFADNGFQYTIHETTLQALYVPFPAATKARTRALLDAVVKPCAYGAGGVLLLLLSQRMAVEKLSLVTSGLVLAWLASIPLVKKRYLASLESTLSSRGTLALDADFVLDAASRDALLRVLERGNPRHVLAALEQLGSDATPELRSAVEKLATSEVAEVRRAALEKLGALPGASPEPARAALDDGDPLVRRAAVTAVARLSGDESVDVLVPRLSDSDEEVRVATIAGLLRDAGVEGAIAGGSRLEQLIASPEPSRRREAALVLGAVGPGAYRPLTRLLADVDPQVRRAALRACEFVADPRLVPVLVELLRDPAVRLRAANALAAIGPASVEPLLALMSDEACPRDVRLVVPRVLRHVPVQLTYERLMAVAEVADSHLRLRVFGALSRLRQSLKRPPETLDSVRRLLESELSRGYRNLAGWEAAEERYGTPLLAEEMQFRHMRAIRRILRILELRYDPEPLRLVRERIEEPSRRAHALEVLDTMLEPSLRPMVMRFFDDVPARELCENAGPLAPEPQSAESFLREEAAHANPYITLVVLDALARQKDPLGLELGTLAVKRPEPLAREGAVIAFAALGSDEALRLLTELARDPDPAVARHATLELSRLSGAREETRMYSTVEKILFLKSAPLFAKVTGEDLGPLAHVAEEVSYSPGQHIFEQGETGDSLFVVVRGKVGIVHDGDTVATLGPGEAFGEMAVLDKLPRSTAAVATEECELLRIGSQEFYEILHEQVEIAVGVIRMLTQRLRETTSAEVDLRRARLNGI
ncbi:MAG: Npt1/Npt2 family nucleotide transporter [Polyangiaceae bacterium]